MKSEDDLYTTLAPDEVWKIYWSIECLFRGGGSRGNPNLIGPKGPRAKDFDIRYDAEERIEMVFPNQSKGISFSDNIPRLQKLGISGVIWKLPKDSIIPKGLVINYKTKDHPLINVQYKMSSLELEAKLKVVSQQMIPSEVKIK